MIQSVAFWVISSAAHEQVEVHPIWRNDELIAYCRSKGIHVSAYCPLGTPWTSAKAVIRRAHPASQHPVINDIAKKYNKHVLHIIMRWGLQHGTSILAKSSNPGRIKVCALLDRVSEVKVLNFSKVAWSCLSVMSCRNGQEMLAMAIAAVSRGHTHLSGRPEDCVGMFARSSCLFATY